VLLVHAKPIHHAKMTAIALAVPVTPDSILATMLKVIMLVTLMSVQQPIPVTLTRTAQTMLTVLNRVSAMLASTVMALSVLLTRAL